MSKTTHRVASVTDEPAPSPRYRTVREAREYTTLSKATIYRLIAAGRLPIHKVGRRTIIATSDLDALVTGEAA